MRSLAMPGSDQGFLTWLETTERRAILPLRFAMLVLTVLIWEWAHDWLLPPNSVFILFFCYTMALAFAAYVLLLRRLDSHQVRPLSISSLIIDGVFIAGLVHLDQTLSVPGQISSDYYIFFFLLVLRGFAVLERQLDLLVMNVIVLAIFVTLLWVQQPHGNLLDISPVVLRDISVKTSLIILVMGLSWFLLGTLTRQRLELMQVRERLMRSESLATLGEIVAGVAHEINNPVGIISAYADFLLKKAGDQRELTEDFQVIRSEAKRCQQIVSQLLSFANPNVSRMQQVELPIINEEVLHLLFLDKRNNLIDIQQAVAPDCGPIMADSVQLKQALLNIYMNARHAMGDEGRIDIDMRPDPEERRAIRIRIRDTGPGISERAKASLFEPFYTSKDQGTGLGLAITRRIIEAHDGTIEADNAEEGGAIFTIRLPMARRR